MSGTTLMEQIARKLGVLDDPRLLEKATEMLRLLEIKALKVVSTVGDYGKTTICIDLASEVLGIPFDIEDGIKASGLRKSVYVNYKRTFEKFLNLNKPSGISEICIRLGLNDISKKANEILDLYKGSMNENVREIDFSHPQYSAMAVYQACKIEKRKISKSKIISYSHLKPSQWCKLEQQWDKLMEGSCLLNRGQKRSSTIKENSPKKFKDDENTKVNSKSVENEVEDYEIWKNRMLAMARLELSLLEGGLIGKENRR